MKPRNTLTYLGIQSQIISVKIGIWPVKMVCNQEGYRNLIKTEDYPTGDFSVLPALRKHEINEAT